MGPSFSLYNPPVLPHSSRCMSYLRLGSIHGITYFCESFSSPFESSLSESCIDNDANRSFMRRYSLLIWWYRQLGRTKCQLPVLPYSNPLPCVAHYSVCHTLWSTLWNRISRWIEHAHKSLGTIFQFIGSQSFAYSMVLDEYEGDDQAEEGSSGFGRDIREDNRNRLDRTQATWVWFECNSSYTYNHLIHLSSTSTRVAHSSTTTSSPAASFTPAASYRRFSTLLPSHYDSTTSFSRDEAIEINETEFVWAWSATILYSNFSRDWRTINPFPRRHTDFDRSTRSIIIRDDE